MNVHIIRTDGVKESLIDEILQILKSVPGPAKFLKGKGCIMKDALTPVRKAVDSESFEGNSFCVRSKPLHVFSTMIPKVVSEVTWDQLFDGCLIYRKEHDIGDEEFIVLLTNLSNEKNWFSAYDPKNLNNAFVQTTYWDYFIPGGKVFPVTYEVVANVLQSRMFESYHDHIEKTHREPRGCMNDMSKDKKQVTFKLRTGDICGDCQMIIVKKKIDIMLVHQVFSIFNKIRSEMLYMQQFRSNLAPGKMQIDLNNKTFLFPDYKNVLIKLNPLELTVYLFLIRHNEGVSFPEFADYEEELLELYKELTNTADLAKIRNNIHNLAWDTDGSLSQKISNINRNFVKNMSADLAGFYKIQGASNERRHIPLDRNLIKIKNSGLIKKKKKELTIKKETGLISDIMSGKIFNFRD